MLLKEVNCDQKYVMCTYLRDKNFEVLCAAIKLDEIYLAYSETVREKPTINDAGFTTYSNTILFFLYGYITMIIL